MEDEKLNWRTRIYRFVDGTKALLKILIEREKGHYCGIEMYEQTYLEKPIEEFETKAYGNAVDECFGRDGKLYATNDEYCNQVNFCPLCGYKAEKTVGLKKFRMEKMKI